MIKEVKIFNRFNMEMFARTNGLNFPYNYWHLISIHSGDPLINPQVRHIFEKIGCHGLISVEFWDMTLKDKAAVLKDYPNANVFSKKDAARIINFLDKVQKDNKDSTLVVHCHAGISRSGAVGTFACDYCRLNYNEFLKNNPCIHANSHVLRTLREVAHMTPDFGTHDGIDNMEGTLND
jgi:predicted protein tyrosine phosphatase